MSTTKQELRKMVSELSDDESRILLKFAGWLKEQKEELSEKEMALLLKGQQQIREGDFVLWRDIKRTHV
jgi:hypothetical protein